MSLRQRDICWWGGGNDGDMWLYLMSHYFLRMSLSASDGILLLMVIYVYLPSYYVKIMVDKIMIESAD